MRLSLQLAISSLKKNKKRSMVALLAIIITIGFLTAINQISINSKQNRIIQAKRWLGEYHFKARLSGKEEEEKFIKTLPEGSEYGMDSFLGEILLNDNCEALIRGTEEIYFKSAGIILVEGRFPEKPYEICIEENSINEWGIKGEIGEKFKKTLMVYGEEIEIELTLAGIMDSTNSIGYRYLKDTTSAYLNDKTTFDIFSKIGILMEELYDNKQRGIIVILPEVHEEIFEEILELTNTLKYDYKTSINSALFAEIINLNNDRVDYIIMAVIIIACVLFIFNIFNISALEKIKEYGTLRAIGFTKEQIYQLVILEAMILGLIGIPIGILLGSGIGYSIMGFVNNRVGIETLINEIQYKSFLPIALIGMGVIYFSALIPANRTSKIQPVEALRYITNIKRVKKNRLSNIFEKIGGIKLKLAYDNMWINRGRTILTIMSISGSVFILLLTMYLHKNNKIISINNEKYSLGDYELNIKKYSNDEDETNKINMEMIEQIKGIHEDIEIFGYDELPYGAIVEKVGSLEGVEGCFIYGFDDALLSKIDKYMLNGKLDIAKLKNTNSAIIINKYKSNDRRINNYILDNVNIGDEVGVKKLAIEDGKVVRVDGEVAFNYYDNLIIEGIVDEFYPHLPFEYMEKFIYIVISKDRLKHYMDDEYITEEYTNIVIKANTTDKEDLKSYESIVKKIAVDNKLEFTSYKEETEKLEKQIKNIKLMALVVILAIMALGLMNIITTVTTNVIQRSREFATIRAVGVTREEMGQIIIYEGLCWGLISGIVSIILALFGSIALGKIMSIDNIISTIPWLQYLITLIGVMVVCVLVTLIPLKKVLKSNIIESLREM